MIAQDLSGSKDHLVRCTDLYIHVWVPLILAQPEIYQRTQFLLTPNVRQNAELKRAHPGGLYNKAPRTNLYVHVWVPFILAQHEVHQRSQFVLTPNVRQDAEQGGVHLVGLVELQRVF